MEALAPEAGFLSQDLRYIRKRRERQRQRGISDGFVCFCLCGWCRTPAHAGEATHTTCMDKFVSHGTQMLAIIRAPAFVKRNCCTDCKLPRGQIPPPKGFPHLRFIDVWHTGRVSWVCDTQHSRWKCNLHEVPQRLAWCCSGRPPWVDLARFSRCSLVPRSAPAHIAHERMQQSAVSQSHSLNPGLTQLHNWQLHKTCYGRSNRCFNPDSSLWGF